MGGDEGTNGMFDPITVRDHMMAISFNVRKIHDLTTDLYNAMQELQKRIDVQDKRTTDLEKHIACLETEWKIKWGVLVAVAGVVTPIVTALTLKVLGV